MPRQPEADCQGVACSLERVHSVLPAASYNALLASIVVRCLLGRKYVVLGLSW
jgi:hypothetical protein